MDSPILQSDGLTVSGLKTSLYNGYCSIKNTFLHFDILADETDQPPMGPRSVTCPSPPPSPMGEDIVRANYFSASEVLAVKAGGPKPAGSLGSYLRALKLRTLLRVTSMLRGVQTSGKRKPGGAGGGNGKDAVDGDGENQTSSEAGEEIPICIKNSFIDDIVSVTVKLVRRAATYPVQKPENAEESVVRITSVPASLGSSRRPSPAITTLEPSCGSEPEPESETSGPDGATGEPCPEPCPPSPFLSILEPEEQETAMTVRSHAQLPAAAETIRAPTPDEGGEKWASKWAGMVHWVLTREKSVQDALSELQRMQLERYYKIGAKNEQERAYFQKLADVPAQAKRGNVDPEHALSLGTLACCQGKCQALSSSDNGACVACWKVRRANKLCGWGTLCRYCHCHPAAKPNHKNRKKGADKGGEE